ncbi:MAG: GxxExxY protein [Longimicrobiales bacterium]
MATPRLLQPSACPGQKPISFDFEGLWFENAFRADLIVESAVIVEVKSLPALASAHEKQLLTYQRVLDYRVGLLLNVEAPLMKDGITRFVHRLQVPRASS